MLILRTIDPTTYHKFIRFNMTDKQVSDHLFSLPGLQSIKWTRNAALFETLLIVAYLEFMSTNNIHSKTPESPLYDHYKTSSNQSNLNPQTESHAKSVIHLIETYKNTYNDAEINQSHTFQLAIQHIELAYNFLPDNS